MGIFNKLHLVIYLAMTITIKKLKMESSKTTMNIPIIPEIIAEAIVQNGYEVTGYDFVLCDCTYECYASFVEIYFGDWLEYDIRPYVIDPILSKDFKLGNSFHNYLIRKYSDGSRDSKKIRYPKY